MRQERASERERLSQRQRKEEGEEEEEGTRDPDSAAIVLDSRAAPQAVAAFPWSLPVPVCRSTKPRPRAAQEAREEGVGLGAGWADPPLCRPELENYQTRLFLRFSLVLKFQS